MEWKRTSAIIKFIYSPLSFREEGGREREDGVAGEEFQETTPLWLEGGRKCWSAMSSPYSNSHPTGVSEWQRGSGEPEALYVRDDGEWAALVLDVETAAQR